MKNALQRACLALPCILFLAVPQAMAGQHGSGTSPSSSRYAHFQQLEARSRQLKADLLDQRLSAEKKTGHLLLLLESKGHSQPLNALSVSVDHGNATRHTYTERERQVLAGGVLQPLSLPQASKGKHVLHIRISALDGHGDTHTWQTTRTFSSDGTTPDALLLSLDWTSHPAGKKMPRISLRALP